MIKKIIRKSKLHERSQKGDDLNYWLKQPVVKHLEAVDYLRRHYYGNTARLQRVYKVVKRK